MRTKAIGGIFLFVSLLVWAAFVLALQAAFVEDQFLLMILIPAIKVWAFAELITLLGIAFFFLAPDDVWSWRQFFSIDWWRADWLPSVFRMLLLFGLVFLIVAIGVDFVYKLGLASGWFL